jgi:hypothetical protein
MNVEKILLSLRQQRRRLDRAIAALESLKSEAREKTGGSRPRSLRKFSGRRASNRSGVKPGARRRARVIPFAGFPPRRTGTGGNLA